MNSINRKHRLSTLAALTVAATAFALPAFATNAPLGAGEGFDPAQQVQMSAPITAAAPTQISAPQIATAEMAATDPTYTYTPAATVGPLSREEVREALSNWRNAGILVPANEIGDTNETLAARDAFNEMQAEAITARWAQETERMAKARQTEYAAQLARQEIEAVLAAAAREEPVDTAAVGNGLTVEMPLDVTEPVLVQPAAPAEPATPAVQQ